MRSCHIRRVRLAIVVVGAVATCATGEMLSNAGFDAPKWGEPPECDQAAGWERWGSWANRHASQPGWVARNGAGMMAYHHWQSDSMNAGWYQDVEGLEPGCVYTFSVWAQWEGNCNASNIDMKLEKYGGGGPDYVVHRYTSAEVGTEWTKICVQGVLPEGVTSARLAIECMHGFGGNCASAQGAIKFDDASLVAGPGTVIRLSRLPVFLVGVGVASARVWRRKTWLNHR